MTNETPSVESSKATTHPEFSQDGSLTKDEGVFKEIITHGVNGFQKPEDGDDVTMHYRGTLLDGTQFDSSYDRSTPFTFKLGDGKVIKGWDIAGKTMAKGEKAKITLKSEYAYGEAGSPPKIPPNATLIFEMELVSWVSKRDVFGDGLVIKSEHSAGEGWERPGKLDEVTLSVVTTSMDADGRKEGVQLYSGDVTFTNGAGGVPAAWEKVILDMKKGSAVSLLCKGAHTTGPGLSYIPEGTPCVRFELVLKSWRTIDDIHKDGTLVKKMLKEGDGWERPNEGSDVTINAKFYRPTKGSDLLVPPPTEEEPLHVINNLSFRVGDGIVIDGLDRVVQSMKNNESAMVFIDPSHAFENAHDLVTPELAEKGISIDSELLLEVTVSKFEKGKDVWTMSFEDKLEEMRKRKQIGTDLFKKGRYTSARKSYDRAVAFFDSPTSELDPSIKSQVNELLVQCHINLAFCLDKIGDIQKVMSHCKKALEIAPSNVKALYRQGCAYLAMEDYYNSSAVLKYALELDPSNTAVRRKLKEVRNKQQVQDATDKKLYSNLFGRLNKMEEKESIEKKVVPGNDHTKGKSEEQGMNASPKSADVAKKDTTMVEAEGQ